MNFSKLDKQTRDALPDDMFAFARTRQVPINDEHHTRLAWRMLDATKGVTDEERMAARGRVLQRAKTLGMDTKDWNKVQSMTIECMSLNIATGDHPNKMPFSGVLTKLDEPSDGAPGGANGKKVIVTSDAARAALSSVLGMAVDFTPSFDGHDAQKKIGIITSADIVGNELVVEGFVYAADFPETAELIQQLKDVLGFSFEAQRIFVEDMSASILRVIALTFTGAAILLKDKAAFKTTRLAASADTGDLKMTPEELKAILDNALKPITDRLTAVEAANTTIVGDITATNKIKAQVEPHAAALDTVAATMAAAGIDASHLKAQAAHMRSEAAAGRMPSLVATMTVPAAKPGAVDDVAIKAMIAEALKPVQNQLDETKTLLTDAQNQLRLGAGGPGRKTIAPQVTTLMAKANLAFPEGDKKLQIGEVDAALAKASLSLSQRLMLKGELTKMGAL